MANGSNGWPNAIAYLTGLSTPQFMLSGLDAALHLAEECLEPERIVPRAVMVTVLIAFVTAFPFAIAAVYSCKDVAAVLDDPTGYFQIILYILLFHKLMKQGADIQNLDASDKLPHRRNSLHGLSLHSILRRAECRTSDRVTNDMVFRARRRTLRLEMARPCTRGTKRPYLLPRGKRRDCHANRNSLCLLYNRYPAPPSPNITLTM